jgi:hypothetical protein
MGKYINKNSNGTGLGSSASDKINRLVEDGATTINTPVEWNENLVCVVDNGFFGAAGYAYDEKEMNQFLSPDGRPKQWLKYIHAKEIAE